VLIGESVSIQRGFALIALLALAALISAFLIASALNLTSAGNSNEREDRSMSALRKAKAALIAYAASEQWQLYKTPSTYFQPGALPCPDQDDDGDADCTGSTSFSMIGRVPFKTLGIDDLRDASGERLWYALSHDFRKMQCPSANCTTINSDTLGQLTVTGMAPATQVVAVVFAPGAALDLRAIGGPLQDRIAGHNDPTNYLENVTLGDNIHFTFTSTGLPTDTFNDRLLVITQADLMAAVEPIVAANIERDVKPLLGDYLSKWGAYPFAVALPPPGTQGAYLGASPQTSGLLPLTNTATLTWQNPTVTQIPPGDGTSLVTSWGCSISSLTATCTVNYSGGSSDRPDIRLQVLLANASAAFADQPAPVTAAVNLPMLDGYGNTPGTTPYGYWSALGSPSRVPTGGTFVAQAGGWSLTYTGRLQNAADMNHQATITVPLPPPGYLPRLTNPSSTSPNIAWFLSNQWYRQTYYAISPGFAPGGVPSGNPAACNPLPGTPSCLTVNNLPPSFVQKNDKQAILVFAGRALDGQTRPSGSPANYLEGQNATPADFIFEHRSGVATTINDRVVVVSP
jgi:type II secretory pathway pseudopilin PulG